ncbi:HNH endonuclease [Parashewanella curva]|uniref:HNH endonuclease n=1 Tax=Parashewanella curva TaxID=2338552 RepID=A0A3L8PSM7_9GAMM|nr:HNH endonuclease [Parashewanella curva]RLV58254.1 HNH endonuclease [Parashewanella curva]
MRPVSKGKSPINGEFNQYQDAKTELVSRLGGYCSYCERKVVTLLAVEHIEPKDLKSDLEKSWDNFLLACANCNSCKSKKPVELKEVLLPDRDNTYAAFTYQDDGEVKPSEHITQVQKQLALKTLSLVGLDKPIQEFKDSNDQLVSLDRTSQRKEVIGEAQVALELLARNANADMMTAIVYMAKNSGYFSIWMKVFNEHPEMKLRFIEVFKGTKNSGCFDLNNAEPITPAPNPDNLEHGGKV